MGTLTTIGFGDKWPEYSFLHYADGFGPFMKMVITVVYSIFGMALISMCIQLMQEQIMEKVTWLMAEIGMGGNSNNIEMMKVTKPERIKKSRKNRLMTKTFKEMSNYNIINSYLIFYLN